jgi:hypothetical protein
MDFLRSLRLQFCPLKKDDPDFGKLLYMYISNHPEKSYWECEWKFPPTRTIISISLPGDELGPYPEVRAFYKEIILKYEEVLALVRPQLSVLFKERFNKELPADIYSELKLSGFSLDGIQSHPFKWNISFETIGDKWLGIMIPFEGDTPHKAVVDD